MKLLKLDMTQGKIKEQDLPDNFTWGGRGLVDYLLTHNMNPNSHPLSLDSVFVLACGMLAGTLAPNSSRISVGGKSLLTGGIKEANSGGTAGDIMGRLGIMAVMAKGKSKTPQLLIINSQGAELAEADFVSGLKNYEACRKLREKYGEKISIVLTGPAGEKGMANSTVAVSDVQGRPARHAARGGLGAVMGVKGLKAILLDGRGAKSRDLKNPDAYKKAVKNAVEVIMSMQPENGLKKYGTAVWINPCNATGEMPTLNHTRGAWDKKNAINGPALANIVTKRGGQMGHACMPGCIVRCSNNYIGQDGEHITSALEYETLAMLGSNLGIDDLDIIAKLDRYCDELGIDTIETGNTIGALNHVGMFNFGDGQKALEYVREIEKATPMGLILGSGTETACKVLGIDRVPAIRGLGIPAHMARACKGRGLSYATSPQSADHTAGYVAGDYLSPIDQANLVKNSQISMAAFDSLGMCWFTFIDGRHDLLYPMINALYGLDWDTRQYLKMGEEMIRMEIAFNRKAGLGQEQEQIPQWLKEETLPPFNAKFDVPDEDYEKVWENF
ncbi:aldehyde ferredoxin oxidoreductase C-terminal domain-containing protein [Desulfobacula sp.]